MLTNKNIHPKRFLRNPLRTMNRTCALLTFQASSSSSGIPFQMRSLPWTSPSNPGGRITPAHLPDQNRTPRGICHHFPRVPPFPSCTTHQTPPSSTLSIHPSSSTILRVVLRPLIGVGSCFFTCFFADFPVTSATSQNIRSSSIEVVLVILEVEVEVEVEGVFERKLIAGMALVEKSLLQPPLLVLPFGFSCSFFFFCYSSTS